MVIAVALGEKNKMGDWGTGVGDWLVAFKC